MFKPVIKTLSLSLIVLLTASQAKASSSVERDAKPRTPAEIEVGWVELHQRFESRLAERGLRDADIPGAIISAPLPGFQASAGAEATTRSAHDVAPESRGHGRTGPRD